MSEQSMPAATPGAHPALRIRGLRSSFTPNTPLVFAVVAFAGTLVPLQAASAADLLSPEPAAQAWVVEDQQALPDTVIVAADAPPALNVEASPDPAVSPQAEPRAETGGAATSSAPAPSQVSAADRLRGDPLETAPVPPDTNANASAKSDAPVRLTKEEQAVAVHITRNFGVERGSIERIVHHAYKAAREVRLDPNLILAVMAVESRFDPNASNNSGAKGLMQVHVKVHRNRFEPFGGADAVYDPPANIKVGAGILSEYVTRYGDVAAGLKAYVGAALLPSDRGYGNKVLNRQAEFDAVLRSEARPTREAKARAPAEGGLRRTSGADDSSTAAASSRIDAGGDSDLDESM